MNSHTLESDDIFTVLSIKWLMALSVKIKNGEKLFYGMSLGRTRNYVEIYFNDILNELI
jgi:hypothetical protein